MTQLKKPSCDKTLKLKILWNSKTQNMTKLKNSNCDKRHDGLQCKQFKPWKIQEFSSSVHANSVNEYENEKHIKPHIWRHHLVYFILCLLAVKLNLCRINPLVVVLLLLHIFSFIRYSKWVMFFVFYYLIYFWTFIVFLVLVHKK